MEQMLLISKGNEGNDRCMNLPFLSRTDDGKPDSIIAVDLGARTTKAVHLRRNNGHVSLSKYVVLDAPTNDSSTPKDLLSRRLKAVTQALKVDTKHLTLALSATDALIRPIETPVMPVEKLRQVLKQAPGKYLEEDLTGYIFDAQVVLYFSQINHAKGGGDSGQREQRVVVTGAKESLVNEYLAGAKEAGLIPEVIVPGVVGPINAFSLAMPDLYLKESVALLDIGFWTSTLSVLRKGELVFNRVINMGGDNLTTTLSETLNVSYAEAESLKVSTSPEAGAALASSLAPLAQELRSELGIFESQYDRAISHIYVSGASARSDVVIQTLTQELMVLCHAWDPTRAVQNQLAPQPFSEMSELAPQFAVAIGAGLAAINPGS
jgi:type IV pilus assembly protein PilM